MLKDLSDDHFFALIFTSEDRLGTEYVDEARGRKENMVPFLSKVLLEEVKGSNLLLTHVVFPLDKMILACWTRR